MFMDSLHIHQNPLTHKTNTCTCFKEDNQNFDHGVLTVTIFTIVIFAGTKPALKLEKGGTTFSSFNQHPSLPFVATDNRPLSPSSHFVPRD